MLDIKEYLKQTKTVLLTQDAFDELMQRASAQPEIIRCRDCRKYRKFDCPMGITVFDAPDPDGYCYKAERRTDGTEQP